MALRCVLINPALTVAQAQSPNPKKEFDVVSVKPSPPDEHNSFMFQTLPGGTIRMAGVPLRMMIMEAYGVKAFQLSGGPEWVRSGRWDVLAKAEGFQGRIPRDQENLMVQAMLADRFHLKFHNELKEEPVYALVVDKNGSKMTPYTSGERQIRNQYGSYAVKKGEVAMLADFLNNMRGQAAARWSSAWSGNRSSRISKSGGSSCGKSTKNCRMRWCSRSSPIRGTPPAGSLRSRA